MLIWTPIAVVVLIIAAYFYSRPITTIPVFINGLIPSLPDANDNQGRGTNTFVFFPDRDKGDPEREIIRGSADEKGIVQSRIASKFSGKEVTIRMVHRAYKPQQLTLTIPEYGIIHTAKLEPDVVYSGTTRGATIADPNKYFKESTATADCKRSEAIRSVDRMGFAPGRIPKILWLLAYIGIIFAFAGDYAANFCSFEPCIESFSHALYLSMVTITTLGYGDVVPTDDLFRILSGVQAVIGVVIIGFFLNSLFYERR